MKNLAVAICIGMLLAGCAGRRAQPVAVMQSYDEKLSCDQLKAEIQTNETKALQLTGENESAHSNNVALGVVGAILFWPALFAIDTGDAEKVEIQALHDRISISKPSIPNRIAQRAEPAPRLLRPQR